MANDGRGECYACGRTDHAFREIADLRARLEQAEGESQNARISLSAASESIVTLQARARRLEEALREFVACFNDMPIDEGFQPAHIGGCQHPYGGRCSCGIKRWRERWNHLEYQKYKDLLPEKPPSA